MRLGLLVNPDAGLGGRLGLKGSDGKAEEARSMGAQDRSGPRTSMMLENFSRIHRSGFGNIVWVTSEGRMGTDWIPDESEIGEIITPHETAESTSAEDTRSAVRKLLSSGIDILVYSGGDGTTRDIVAELGECDQSKLPVIGIPSGVKMHSGCFASSPKAAAEVLSSWISGELLVSSTEVLDLDEELYRKGDWVVRLYAEAFSPNSPRWMQGSKELIPTDSEDEILAGLADHVKETMIDPDHLLIWGSGGTLRAVGEEVGFNLTTLGIDATIGDEQVGTDLNEEQILSIIEGHRGSRPCSSPRWGARVS